jgi:hypothetical protein
MLQQTFYYYGEALVKFLEESTVKREGTGKYAKIN